MDNHPYLALALAVLQLAVPVLTIAADLVRAWRATRPAAVTGGARRS